MKNDEKNMPVSQTRLYKIYSQMKQRCYNPKNQHYPAYGAKGIIICDEWLGENGFKCFQKWALTNGYENALTIDRIDPSKGYSPDNCQWLSRSDNSSRAIHKKKAKDFQSLWNAYIKKQRTVTITLPLDKKQDSMVLDRIAERMRSGCGKVSAIKSLILDDKPVHAYPIVITPSGDDYVVYVPDLEINTQGTGIADAMEMARDAIGAWGCYEQDEKRPIPAPGVKKVESAPDDIVTLVDVDFDEYRRRHEMRYIRKNVTIPSWLNEMAEQAGINFSSTLQEALKTALHVDNTEPYGRISHSHK